MTLDAFANARRDAIATAPIAPDLPATFSETFSSALETGWHFGNSNAYQNARTDALDDYVQGLRKNFGADVDNPYGQVDEFGGTINPAGNLDALNAKVAGLAERYPDFGLKPLTDQDVDRMAIERMQGARRQAGEMAGRETTWGGSAGNLVGGLVAGAADPVNIALLPIGDLGATTALGRVLAFGAIGVASQSANEAVAASTRERAVSGSSADIPSNIIEAGLGGAAVGGALHVGGMALRGLGRLVGIDTAALPTSVRDDVNAATSAAQVATTNPFPGVAGEAAHQDGLATAMGQIARGERVTAADGLDPAMRDAFRDGLRPVLEAGQRLVDPALLNGAVDSWARSLGHELAPDQVAALSDRLRAAGPAEAERIMAEVTQRPLTFAEPLETPALPGLDGLTVPEAPRLEPLADSSLSPELRAAVAREASETIAAARTDPAVGDAVLHDLDHHLAANPDAVYRETVTGPDGVGRTVERPLRDVLAELDAMEAGGRELEACLVGGAGAAAVTIGAAP